MAAWKPPLIIAAVSVSIVGGFYLGGPGLGMAVGALAATAIVVMAVRNPPRRPIVPPASDDWRDHLLVVAGAPLEDSAVIEEIACAARPPEGPAAEVVVVAPASTRFLERWTSDVAPGRERAQRSLVLSLASLATAGVDASARVGDEDLVQTVTDQLRHYPATGVILVSGAGEAEADDAARELRERLRAPFRHLQPRLRPAAAVARSAPPGPRGRQRGARWRSGGPAGPRRAPR